MEKRQKLILCLDLGSLDKLPHYVYANVSELKASEP